MGFFSWFNTKDLPQNSVKKQLIDQTGHFLGGLFFFTATYCALLYGTAVMSLLVNLVWLWILNAATPIRDAPVHQTMLAYIIPTVLIPGGAVIAFVNGIIFPPILIGALGGGMYGLMREYHQHGNMSFGRGSWIDIAFFVLGGAVGGFFLP